MIRQRIQALDQPEPPLPPLEVLLKDLSTPDDPLALARGIEALSRFPFQKERAVEQLLQLLHAAPAILQVRTGSEVLSLAARSCIECVGPFFSSFDRSAISAVLDLCSSKWTSFVVFSRAIRLQLVHQHEYGEHSGKVAEMLLTWLQRSLDHSSALPASTVWTIWTLPPSSHAEATILATKMVCESWFVPWPEGPQNKAFLEAIALADEALTGAARFLLSQDPIVRPSMEPQRFASALLSLLQSIPHAHKLPNAKRMLACLCGKFSMEQWGGGLKRALEICRLFLTDVFVGPAEPESAHATPSTAIVERARKDYDAASSLFVVVGVRHSKDCCELLLEQIRALSNHSSWWPVVAAFRMALLRGLSPCDRITLHSVCDNVCLQKLSNHANEHPCVLIQAIDYLHYRGSHEATEGVWKMPITARLRGYLTALLLHPIQPVAFAAAELFRAIFDYACTPGCVLLATNQFFATILSLVPTGRLTKELIRIGLNKGNDNFLMDLAEAISIQPASISTQTAEFLFVCVYSNARSTEADFWFRTLLEAFGNGLAGGTQSPLAFDLMMLLYQLVRGSLHHTRLTELTQNLSDSHKTVLLELAQRALHNDAWSRPEHICAACNFLLLLLQVFPNWASPNITHKLFTLLCHQLGSAVPLARYKAWALLARTLASLPAEGEAVGILFLRNIVLPNLNPPVLNTSVDRNARLIWASGWVLLAGARRVERMLEEASAGSWDWFLENMFAQKAPSARAIAAEAAIQLARTEALQADPKRALRILRAQLAAQQAPTELEEEDRRCQAFSKQFDAKRFFDFSWSDFEYLDDSLVSVECVCAERALLEELAQLLARNPSLRAQHAPLRS